MDALRRIVAHLKGLSAFMFGNSYVYGTVGWSKVGLESLGLV